MCVRSLTMLPRLLNPPIMRKASPVCKGCLKQRFSDAILFHLSHLGPASIWQREQEEDSQGTEEHVVRARHFATDLSRFKSPTDFLHLYMRNRNVFSLISERCARSIRSTVPLNARARFLIALQSHERTMHSTYSSLYFD